MKLSSNLWSMLLWPALLPATSAFASNKGSLHTTTPENVAGEQLPAGDYKVQWDDGGVIVQVKIMQAGKLVASAPAKILVLDEAPDNDSTIAFVNEDGSQRLHRIYFSGKKLALEIE
jgi:hypothetical protein